MNRRMITLYPLLFMLVGFIVLFVAEHEFQRRVIRDNAEMRQDLQEAQVPQAEIAVLMSAQTKLQANASAYTQITSFVNLILAVLLSIPLYARVMENLKRTITVPTSS